MTLVEILVAVVLMGIAGVAVIGALGAAAMGSGTHRTVAAAQSWAASLGERLSGPGTAYVPCATPDAYPAPDLDVLAGNDAVEVRVAAVEFWTGSAWASSCGGDTGAMQRLTVTAGDDRITETVQVVKRAPIGATVHVLGPGGGTPGGGTPISIAPTPGINGPVPTSTTTTTTTTPAPTTTVPGPTTTAPGGPTTTAPGTTSPTTTSPTTTAPTTTAPTTTSPAPSGLVCTVTGINVNQWWQDTVTIQVQNTTSQNLGSSWRVRATYAGSGTEQNNQFTTSWSGTTVTLTPRFGWLTLNAGASRTITMMEPGGSMSGLAPASIPCELLP